MKAHEVFKYFGDQTKTAKALSEHGWKITPQAIQYWGERPPKGRQYQIEVLTRGKLKAS